MRKLYFHKTTAGLFYIAEHNGRYHALFENESLGSYINTRQLLDDLVNGYTFSPSSGIDPSTLDISEDLSDWERCS